MEGQEDPGGEAWPGPGGPTFADVAPSLKDDSKIMAMFTPVGHVPEAEWPRLARREMAFDDLGHGIAPSTHSGYRTGWRDWKEFVDKHDLYELVTLGRVIAYLRWKHSDNPFSNTLGRDMNALGKLREAHELVHSMGKLNVREHPEVKGFIARLKRGTRAKNKRSLKDVGAVVKNLTYTQAQKVTILNFMLACLPDVGDSLKFRAMFAIQDACLMRGDNVRGLTLKELFVWDVPSVGPDNCLAFGFILGGGKTNQNGRHDVVFCVRHKNPEECPVGALAMYLAWRFRSTEGDGLPSFTSREEWYFKHLFLGNGCYGDCPGCDGELHPVIYKNHLRVWTNILRELKMYFESKTHAGRIAGSMDCQAVGVSYENTKVLGKWNRSSDADQSYLKGVPAEACLGRGHHPIKPCPAFILKRDRVDRDGYESLAEAVFPGVRELLNSKIEGTQRRPLRERESWKMEPGWQEWHARAEEVDLQRLLGVAEQFRSQGARPPRSPPAAGGMSAIPQAQAAHGFWADGHAQSLPFLHLVPNQPLSLASGNEGNYLNGGMQHLLPPGPLLLGTSKPFNLMWPGSLQPANHTGLATADEQQWDSGDGSAALDLGNGHLPAAGSSHALDEALCHREKNRKAQRKFRERQKAKLAETEARVAELSAELERVKLQAALVETRNAILEKVLAIKMQEGDGGKVGEESAVDGESAFAPPSYITVTIRQGEPRCITLPQLKSMSWEELVGVYKDYVQALAMALVDAAGPHKEEKEARLQQLVDEVAMLFICLNTANPKGVGTLRCMNMEEGANLEARQPHTGIMDMIKACDFTDEQRRIIFASRRQFLVKLGTVLAQRRDLSQQLLAAMPSLDAKNNAQLGRCDVASSFVKALDAADRLRMNLREEQEIMAHFTVAVRSLLTPYQVATCIVRAYPYVPDALQVFNVLAEEIGEPCAAGLLAGAAQNASSPDVLALAAKTPT